MNYLNLLIAFCLISCTQCKAQSVTSDVSYYVRANKKGAKPSEFGVIGVYKDSLIVSIRGTGVIVTNDSVSFYPENGYTIILGRIHKIRNLYCLSYSVIAKSMKFSGEHLPSKQVSQIINFIPQSYIKTESEVFLKIPDNKISSLLKRYSSNKNYREKKIDFMFDCTRD